jgi:hypothetical protein
MATTEPNWRRVDLISLADHHHIDPDDYCSYAREYISGGGYKASETNNLVSNFKKEPSKRGTYQWKYKIQAIDRFADELARAFEPDESYNVCAIPPSKVVGDPEYDSRFEDLFWRLRLIRPKIRICNAITRAYSVEAAHARASRPTIDEVYQSLRWDTEYDDLDYLILIDDVLTAGTSFKACERLIREHLPHVDFVAGLFWARRVFPNGTTP